MNIVDKMVIVMLLIATIIIVIAVDRLNSVLIYHVCNESRVSRTINEKECGELQDRFGKVFLCERHNMNVDNHCWVAREQ